jgi:hypothetical protein
MPRNPEKSYISVPLTKAEREKLQAIAIKEDRALSNLAAIFIREGLERREQSTDKQ